MSTEEALDVNVIVYKYLLESKLTKLAKQFLKETKTVS